MESDSLRIKTVLVSVPTLANGVGPKGAHTTAQIVRLTRIRFTRNLNFSKIFSMAYISGTVADELWPSYFSGSCGRGIRRAKVRCRWGKKSNIENFGNFWKLDISPKWGAISPE